MMGDAHSSPEDRGQGWGQEAQRALPGVDVSDAALAAGLWQSGSPHLGSGRRRGLFRVWGEGPLRRGHGVCLRHPALHGEGSAAARC